VAMNEGTIQLVLRGYGDPDSVTTAGATSTDVLAQLRSRAIAMDPAPKPERRHEHARPAPAPVMPAPQPVRTVVSDPKRDSVVVRVYRGDKMSQQKFEQKDST